MAKCGSRHHVRETKTTPLLCKLDNLPSTDKFIVISAVNTTGHQDKLAGDTQIIQRSRYTMANPTSGRQNPSDFLKKITGRFVVVKLHNGSDYRGVLKCLDGYMNIVLEQTEEYINGEFKRKYGDAFIRGNNVFYISTQKRIN